MWVNHRARVVGTTPDPRPVASFLRYAGRVSLLDMRQTAAWTTVRIDHGPQFGAQRYAGYAPNRYLDNMMALAYLQSFPPTSSLMQWDGRAWRIPSWAR